MANPAGSVAPSTLYAEARAMVFNLPRADVLRRIAEVVGADIGWLLTGSGATSADEAAPVDGSEPA